MQNKLFSTNKTLNIKGSLLDLSKPQVMGIINVTPDSFYKGSRFITMDSIKAEAEKMLSAGASFIDVGGYSSRPGSENIGQGEELDRILPAIRILVHEFPSSVITVDTFRSEVARQALEEGAGIVNDISGGSLDNNMYSIVAKYNVPFIMMHMRGNPQTMTSQTNYQNLLLEIIEYFHSRIFLAQEHGIKDFIIDPGFGFSKTIDQNFELLNHMNTLKVLEKPILAGLSRKSMIWKTLKSSANEALNGTTALNMVALLKGANILRVHDVKEAMECIYLFNQFSQLN